MYYIGEGGLNLKQMDKHLKTKSGNRMQLFSSTVINDQYLKDQESGTLFKDKKSKSKSRLGGKSEMSGSTAASINNFNPETVTLTSNDFTKTVMQRMAGMDSSRTNMMTKSINRA